MFPQLYSGVLFHNCTLVPFFTAAQWCPFFTTVQWCSFSNDTEVEALRKNIALVDIFYSKMSYEKITEVRAIDLLSLVCK